uniref:Uncharacterized protein n=1 Tax=Cacopsylla melanoneura TaxID=428564 RepID=A0A8D8ZD19_9HEMI
MNLDLQNIMSPDVPVGTKLQIVLHKTMSNKLVPTVTYPYVDRTWMIIMAAFIIGFLTGLFFLEANSNWSETVAADAQVDYATDPVQTQEDNDDLVQNKEDNNNLGVDNDQDDNDQTEVENQEDNDPSEVQEQEEKRVKFAEWVQTDSGILEPLKETPSKPLVRKKRTSPTEKKEQSSLHLSDASVPPPT